VILDNTASIRNYSLGYFVKNSRIKATGHFVAWRNYTKDGVDAADRKPDGGGLLSLNSDIEFDPTYYEDSRKYLNWFGKSKRGFELRNSTVRGGIYSTVTSAIPNAGSTSGAGSPVTTPLGAIPNAGSTSGAGSPVTTPLGTSLVNCSGAGGDYMTTILHTADCNENGFHFEGSDVEFLGRLNSYLNEGDGLKAIRSQIRVPQMTLNHNSKYGLELEASQLLMVLVLTKYLTRWEQATSKKLTPTPRSSTDLPLSRQVVEIPRISRPTERSSTSIRTIKTF
jgi:hypothetical protein